MEKLVKNSVRKDVHTKVKAPIVEAMREAFEHPTYQFHIPGHTKGRAMLEDFKQLTGTKVMALDTTDEFDNLGTLHPATGPIKEALELAAEAFGAARTFFLLNGSTVGNIAMALSCTRKGNKVLVNRNCHRSILTGLILSGAEPVWAIPKQVEGWSIWGSVSPQDIEDALSEHDDISLVWITNPTYEGVVSDIKSISAICRRYGVPLIVDEAHGCLWNFSDALPTTALKLGADAVLHSLHKTGGSMSQSSMLHIAKGSMINAESVEKALKLMHTTSPSMLLMASLDAARANLTSFRGKKLISRMIKNAKYLRRRIDNMENVYQLKPDFGFLTDVTKVFVRVDGLSGKRLETILELDFNIEVESASDVGVLLLVNQGNTFNDVKYLADALEKVSQSNYTDLYYLENRKHMPLVVPQIKITPREAYFAPKETISKYDAIGRIAAEVIAECPPGISILLPGEVIREEHLPYLKDYEFIEVVKEA